ncbi:MAG TPA: hypothetical protein VLD60_13120 [Nitrospira sp.]|nr:hypothetical protein [Nitrospira sp.]
MWFLLISFLLLAPAIVQAESRERPMVPPLPADSGPITVIPWGTGTTSYWDDKGQETRTYQTFPGIGYYTGPAGSGFMYDNFSRRELSVPSTSPSAPWPGTENDLDCRSCR